jgi:two-component system NtrC family sensor kinase
MPPSAKEGDYGIEVGSPAIGQFGWHSHPARPSGQLRPRATRRARSGGDARFVPTLKVTTIDAGQAVEIRVRDHGTGIPADIRDKLFQPFLTTKPTGEGTGLGLSITYDIITQQHGGRIAVDSKVGEYSEFTIQLPRYRP